ncbi:uncharacterized protein LOC122251364 [Penaeus japonicus]|uniref:uncharacterized protein LOC122251364 n=1 Tax=Penaeus japonicus TaxID=27405 RepID=UPI001C70DBF8|nr:uncharacterized protein LOC122251364 [Penaeus japonicus]XP_042869191.1 uncharacterized protein LOC122251364 [Penaeus japonicus]XP_042869192.1 uncharacterized protein LOC122251364 [Penaeus japonicus]
MDMLMSANNAILNTRTSVDRFTGSLDNLAESVGTAAFVAIMAGAFALSAGLGNASLFALARIDESFFQPLIARISSSETWTDLFSSALDERSLDAAANILDLVTNAYAKYTRGRRSR